MKNNLLKKYIGQFTEGKFWTKLTSVARQAGIKVVYTALLLYFAYNRKETPAWARRIVLGILGYLIAPIDALPDLSPIIGYTDDLGMLSFGLVTIAAYVNADVREKARAKLRTWFGEYDQADLQSIDDKL